MLMSEIEVHEKDANRVDKDISNCAFSKRNECLMVFVGDSIERGNNSRKDKRFPNSKKRLKSAKKENGEYCILSNMPPFLNKNIEGIKV